MLASRIFDRPGYRWWVFAAVALGTLASVVNHSGMSVALPTIARHFNADLSIAQWVVIAEGLAISALILPMGRLSDIFGRKRVFITGMALFAVAAILASGSPTIWFLIAFMAVQGLGAAMLQGTAIAIVTSVFPEDERGKGIGSHGSVAGAGGVLGPVIGGFLITAFDWRWIFYVNATMAIVAIIAAVCLVRSEALQQDTRSQRYDFTGAALSAAVLLTFLLAVSNGSQMGWTSLPIVAAILGFVGFLAVFVWWELRSPAPMLDLRLFRSRVFSIGLSTNFMSFVATTSARFLLPFYLLGVLGYTPAVIGLVLLPNAAGRIVLGVVGGHLSDRFGRRPFTVTGMLLSAAGLFTLASLGVSSSLVHVLTGVLLQSVGIGLFQSPNSASIFSTVETGRHGVVSAFVSLSRNSGTVTGTAIATSIVVAVMSSGGYEADINAVLGSVPESGLVSSFMVGLRAAFLIMGVLQLASAAASFFSRPSTPQPDPSVDH